MSPSPKMDRPRSRSATPSDGSASEGSHDADIDVDHSAGSRDDDAMPSSDVDDYVSGRMSSPPLHPPHAVHANQSATAASPSAIGITTGPTSSQNGASRSSMPSGSATSIHQSLSSSDPSRPTAAAHSRTSSTATTPAGSNTAGSAVPAHPAAGPSRKPVSSSRRKDPASARMRSTIACCRCRRSKVKCINGGVNTRCQACQHSSRECTYPTPGGAATTPATATFGLMMSASNGLGGGSNGVGGNAGGVGSNGAVGVAGGSGGGIGGSGGATAAPTGGIGAANGTTNGAGIANSNSTAPPAATPAAAANNNHAQPSSAAAVIVAAAAAASNGTLPGGTLAGTIRARDERDEVHHGPVKRARTKRGPTSHLYPAREGRSAADALDPTVLTARVWIELVEIWNVHFSADLPFLHLPTVHRPLHQASESTPTMPPASPVLLCAFLALTAPHHTGLVSHHALSGTSRTAMAEFYADAARVRLAGPAGLDLFVPDLQRVQALLMMAFYDWGSGDGTRASMMVAVAVRLAQMMGLQYEPALDNAPLYRAVVPDPEVAAPAPAGASDGLSDTVDDDFIQREIRRRTFWSCFILDRYFSTGKLRPAMLEPGEVRIQLPCSDNAFLFGHNVQTRMLGSDGDADGQESPRRNGFEPFGSHADNDVVWEVGSEEGSASRFVKMTALFGSVGRYLCLGGGRAEGVAHRHLDSGRVVKGEAGGAVNGLTNGSATRPVAAQLVGKLRRFSESLPRSMQLSAANISAHVTTRTSTTYLAMHTLQLLATVLLHRDRMPVIPRRRRTLKVESPAAYFAEDVSIEVGESTATAVFRAAREIIDVFRSAHHWNVLPATPNAGFAIFQAALMGLYAVNFPWMDSAGSLHRTMPKSGSAGAHSHPSRDDHGLKATHTAIELVSVYAPTTKAVVDWLVTLQRVNAWFVAIRAAARDGRLVLYSGTDGNAGLDWSADADAAELDTLLRTAVGAVDASGRLRPAMKRGESVVSSAATATAQPEPKGANVSTGPPTTAESSHPTTGTVRREGWTAINSGGRDGNGSVTSSLTNGKPAKTTNGMNGHGIDVTMSDHGVGQPKDGVLDVIDGLDLPFSADDLAAHLAGADWKEWAICAVDGQGVRGRGWLGVVFRD